MIEHSVSDDSLAANGLRQPIVTAFYSFSVIQARNIPV